MSANELHGPRRVRVRVATIPAPYKDPADLIQGAGADAFGQVIRAAQPASAWVVDHVEDLGADLHTPEGQTGVAELLFDMLLALPAIERDARVQQLAKRVDLPPALLRQALNELYLRRRRARSGRARYDSGAGPDDPVEERRGL